MSTPRGNLPPINFTKKSAETTIANIITTYEAIAGRSLLPGDPVRLFLQSVAAIIVQQRNVIDFAAKQNLLSYVTDDYVDYLGELVGVTRLEATPALTTIRFTLSAPRASVYTIPAGVQVSLSGQITFATTEPLEIPIGSVTGDVSAECTENGTIGNGLVAGQIFRLVEPLPFVQSATNITTSAGGADREGVESMVDRIRLAPSSFSVAGPVDAYVYWALTANQGIIDVAVSTPEPDDIKQLVYDVLAANSADPSLVSAMESALDAAAWPGTVDIRVLMENGELPTVDVIQQVGDVLSADDVRPLTDYVQVDEPSAVSYDIDIEYWLYGSDSSNAATLQNAVSSAIDQYRIWQKTKIGRDINPDELRRLVMNAGAKRVIINSPAFTVLTDTQVAQDGSVTVTYQGVEDA